MRYVNRWIGPALAVALALGGAASPASSANRPSGAPAEYLLGPGDRIKVTVYQEQELSGEYLISPSGLLSLPLAGDLIASGVSLPKLENEIRSALQPRYMKSADVSVDLVTLRPFYILGEVNRPGQYPYAAALTVLGAVATAGGFTYRANQRRIFIKHADEVDEHRYPLSASTLVSAGDTIRVDERHF